MSSLTIQEQLNLRRKHLKRKTKKEEHKQDDYEYDDDEDINMQNNLNSSQPNQINNESNNKHNNNQISYEPQINSIQKKINSTEKCIKQLYDKINKETMKLSKLQHKLKQLKQLQQIPIQSNDSNIPPQLPQTHSKNNNNSPSRHSKNKKKHSNRKRHRHRHSNHNGNHKGHHNHNGHNGHFTPDITPQLIREEQRRIVSQEEHDREIALQLQRQLDREQNEYESQLQQQENEYRQRRNRNRIRNRNRNRNQNSDSNDPFDDPFFDDDDDELDDHFNIMINGRRIRANSMNRAENVNGLINSRNPYSLMFNSSVFSNGSFDDSGFNAIHRHRMIHNINNINRIRGQMGGIMMNDNDLDNMSYEQLNNLFPNVPRGANEESIQRLPTDVFQSKEEEKEDININDGNVNGNVNDENNKCCICLEQFKNGDGIKRLPCMHIFHKDEIDQWLRQNRVCPICRINVEQHQ